MSVVGYRFHPTDEELINHYLRLKNKGKDSEVQVIPEVDLCKFEPWDLPGLSVIKSDDPEWFFFSSRNQKYAKGHRFDRSTKAGYWKATGNDRPIKSRSSGMKLIGMKKTLVFYKGRTPNAEKTAWVIHEYHMNSEKYAYVLCRLFNKDVTVEYSNYDEIEVSSPEDTPSNQPKVQSTSKSDMQVGEQLTCIEKCLADKSGNITTSALIPKKRNNNAYVPSDVEDREVEEELLSFLNNLSPLRSEMSIGLGSSYMDSPFANKLDDGHNGMPFHGDDYELDLNYPILRSVAAVHSNQEYSCDESTNHKNSTFGIDSVGAQIRLQSGPSMHMGVSERAGGNDSASYSDAYTRVPIRFERSQSRASMDIVASEVAGDWDNVSDNDAYTRASPPIERSQVGQGERQVSKEISQENDNKAKPTAVEDVGEAMERTKLRFRSFVNLEKDKEISPKPFRRMKLKKAVIWNSKDIETETTVTNAGGEATEHTMIIKKNKEISQEPDINVRFRYRSISRQNAKDNEVKPTVPRDSSLLAAPHVMVVVIISMVLFMLIFGAWRWLKF